MSAVLLLVRATAISLLKNIITGIDQQQWHLVQCNICIYNARIFNQMARCGTVWQYAATECSLEVAVA